MQIHQGFELRLQYLFSMTVTNTPQEFPYIWLFKLILELKKIVFFLLNKLNNQKKKKKLLKLILELKKNLFFFFTE